MPFNQKVTPTEPELSEALAVIKYVPVITSPVGAGVMSVTTGGMVSEPPPGPVGPVGPVRFAGGSLLPTRIQRAWSTEYIKPSVTGTPPRVVVGKGTPSCL